MGTGLIASLARPGRNITGLTGDVAPEHWAKQLDLVKEAVPAISNIAILWNPSRGDITDYWEKATVAAGKLGVRVWRFEIREPSDVESALGTVKERGSDAIVVPGDPITYAQRRRLVEFAKRNRLPVIYGAREYAEIGGLMSYGPNLLSLLRRSANYIDRILKGASPAELPVERPVKLELVINLATANALGLTIPPSLLFQADRVIK
ncbi:MAG: ABC transporter substrate-binding protein [Anaerolineae bacterium]